jgi:hypothetical protein
VVALGGKKEKEKEKTLSKQIMVLFNSLCRKESYVSEGDGIALKVISSLF